MSTVLVLLLAGAGFLISLSFTQAISRRASPGEEGALRFCRPGAMVCSRILHHRDARLLGVPNSVLGLVYYPLCSLAFLLGGRFSRVLLVACWIPVAMGAFLTYSLLARVRVLCGFCFLSHAINLALAILVTCRGGIP
jgi:uncharacterized membrane protein